MLETVLLSVGIVLMLHEIVRRCDMSPSTPAPHSPHTTWGMASWSWIAREPPPTNRHTAVPLGPPSLDAVSEPCTDPQECPICMEPDVPMRRLRRCDHVFCEACMQAWFQECLRCPFCNGDVLLEGKAAVASPPFT